MTNKIVKYTLNADGTVPSSIVDGGYAPKPNGGTPPQDYDFIGVTVDGSGSGGYTGLGELASEADVKTYLDTYTSSWKNRDVDDVETDFDQAAAAAYIWSKKIA